MLSFYIFENVRMNKYCNVFTIYFTGALQIELTIRKQNVITAQTFLSVHHSESVYLGLLISRYRVISYLTLIRIREEG